MHILKLITLVAFFVANISGAQAITIVSEPFSYAIGSLLNTSLPATGSGLTGNWQLPGYSIPAEIIVGTLPVPTNYLYHPEGGNAGAPRTNPTGVADGIVALSEAARETINSGTFYFSFVAAAPQFSAIAFNFSTSDGLLFYDLYFNKGYTATNSTHIQLLTQKATSPFVHDIVAFDPADGISNNLLVVGKVENIPGKDKLTVWFFNSGGPTLPNSEPGNSAFFLDTIDVGVTNISTLSFSVSGGASIDGIRIGTSWNDVSAVVPEPSIATLLSVGFAIALTLNLRLINSHFREC
jgi:hypothetical protein